MQVGRIDLGVVAPVPDQGHSWTILRTSRR
jgi:hypothetical protein